MSNRLPKNAREARIWRGIIQSDMFFHPLRWPIFARDLALSPHRTYRDRYRYFLFLTTNGLTPEVAATWTLADDWDLQRNVPISRGYDRAALAHVQSMTLPKFWERTHQPIFNIELGRPI